MESIDQSVKSFFDNPIVLGVVAIFITMYGPRLSPKLPDFVKDAFNNSVFRFIIMVLVIFSGLKDIRLALIISILFIGLMSIVNTQNIKEDYHNQVQEYYANYNLFDKNSTEHFEDFHENYASQGNQPGVAPNQVQQQDVAPNQPGVAPNQGNQPSMAEPNKIGNSVNVAKPNKDVSHDDDDDEEQESVGINKDSHMVNGNLIEPNKSSNQMNRNTNSRVAKYIDTSVDVLRAMDKFAKTPGAGISEQCQNAIKIPNLKCIKEIKSKISTENLSEMTKNKISRKFEETKWLDD